jgi:hypothetical protein
MNRRKFIKRAGLATINGLAAGSALRLTGAIAGAGYDEYGGWTGKKFEATGFFRVVKDDRWWIVTPDGNAFLSFGINHLHPVWFSQEYQREHLQEVLGISDLRNNEEFGPALRKWFLQTCRDYGINTVGVHNDLDLVNSPQAELPYMQPIRFVDIPHWKAEVPDENFRDIFSQEFAMDCDRKAKQIAAARRDDPYLLAYAMTDCPLFTEEDCRERTDTIGGARRGARIGWPRRLRNLGGDAAGKTVYVETMHGLYKGDIALFNETYHTGFGSFDELEAAIGWRTDTDLSNGNETRDNIEFLKVCVDKYYQVARNAISRYDSNHLFAGDKINANTDTLDTVLPVTRKYTDLVFYQMYGRYEIQEPGLDRWSKIAGKPFLNGDSAYTMITEDMPRPFGPVADDLEQRAGWTREFMEKAFARPDFVGWHYCGLIDATSKNPGKAGRQHSGLIDQYGKPYDILQKCIKQFTGEMYEIAQKNIING